MFYGICIYLSTTTFIPSSTKVSQLFRNTKWSVTPHTARLGAVHKLRNRNGAGGSAEILLMITGLVTNMMKFYPLLYQWYSFFFYSLFHSILYLPIESEIMDQFWCSRYLNDHINLPNMIRLFASSAIASIMAKNGTKENFSNIGIF